MRISTLVLAKIDREILKALPADARRPVVDLADRVARRVGLAVRAA